MQYFTPSRVTQSRKFPRNFPFLKNRVIFAVLLINFAVFSQILYNPSIFLLHNINKSMIEFTYLG